MEKGREKKDKISYIGKRTKNALGKACASKREPKRWLMILNPQPKPLKLFDRKSETKKASHRNLQNC